MSCLASCCASPTCGLCTSVASGITKRSARIAYCGLFGVSLILSWILREVATPLLKHFSWINTFDNLPKEYFQGFNPSGHDCGLNIFFIVMTIVLAFAFAVVALLPKFYLFYILHSVLDLQQPFYPLRLHPEQVGRHLFYNQMTQNWEKETKKPKHDLSDESSEYIDVGWTSVWVRICTEWITAALYAWSLMAPLIFPDREFY
ncbi:unnamed protein product [Fraxinus pennsylvanica]|uniref:Uncharacterized protein n=1 Tax=Fraxinus pennsylvanica TaxID=56036 RepID=A0AAD1Z7N8_9LAMI|nr:unnamed protein product [Fraxinus pennsylvanica]